MERLSNKRSYIKIKVPSIMKDFLEEVYPFLKYVNSTDKRIIFKIYVTKHDIRRIKITKLQGGKLDERSINIITFFSYYGKNMTFLDLDRYIKTPKGKSWQ